MNRQLLTSIITNLDTMRRFFADAKLRPTYLDFCTKNSQAVEFDKDFLKSAADWLQHIFDNEYSKIVAIKKLLPDNLWERYRLWGGFEAHRECILLQQALEKFRYAMTNKSRPEFFRKEKFDAKLRSIKPRKTETCRARTAKKKSGKCCHNVDKLSDREQ